MKVNNQIFGEISYSNEDLITFPDGLPGFTKISKFLLITREELAPFSVLQSIERPEVFFVVVDPKKFRPKYKAEIGMEELKPINITDSSQAKMYSIVTVSDVRENTSMNLKAPIIINETKKMGMQVILKLSDYEIECKIFAPQKTVVKEPVQIRRQEVELNFNC